MRKSNYEFFVTVKDRTIDEYHHDGKVFIEGRKGSNYKVVFKNNTGSRKKVVISVDGLNIMTGKNDWTRGYVVEGYNQIEVPGWRIDASRVAAFEFSSVKGSYNQHNDSGDKKNVGVIGCLVFDEDYKYNYVPLTSIYQHYYHYDSSPKYFVSPTYTFGGTWDSPTVNVADIKGSYTTETLSASSIADRPRSAKAAASAMLSSVPQNSIGTKWGEQTEFKTETVNYTFKDKASETLLLFYDSSSGLCRRGINLKKKVQYHSEPNAFPGYSDGCPFPK